MLRVFLCNFVPLFAFLCVFVASWFHLVDRNLVSGMFRPRGVAHADPEHVTLDIQIDL